MNAVLIVLVVLGFGAFWALRRLRLYPCRASEWRYAFAAAHRDQREALHGARVNRQAVESEQRRHLTRAREHVEEIEQRGRQRARTLKAERRRLLRPGWGAAVGPRVGQLRLHEHVLVFMKEAPEGEEAPAGIDETLPLADLAIGFSDAREHLFLHITRQDGTHRTATFPRADHRETAVRHFRDRIHNQVLAERAFRESARERTAEIDAELQQLESDTAAQREQAHLEATALGETQRADPRLLRALADWEAQCDVWQKLTGRRPGTS
ncbi:hypothetical protein Slala03_11870 [Streptomyces lavendulae subsp. lavendulae]|uniref:hypothetical protein n=1 Tax=Streptomyces lavendulae TaxID=1914 RepID=UPI0024A1782F|nr:hypothetical protein [Streptomyces lavendulae]GLV81498.1 hypothetical protein Slala03_11870 [Streptomyces lavendulae subsp. lavendulae]